MATTVDPRLIHPTSYRLIAEAIEEEGGEVSPHTHSIDQVEGLQTVLDSKQAAGNYAPTAHTHTIAQVTGLQSALDGKQVAGSYAAATHTHTIGNITGLQTALDSKQATGSYATSAQLDALIARVEDLEQAAQ